jgi:hypothetical protein
VTANNQPSLTGAATAGSLVTVYIDGTAVGTTTADGTGAWQYDVATPLQDGAYGTRHRDRYRRQRQYGVHARTFTVDTAAPAIPTGIALTAATDTGASASDGVTANNQPSLTGAATAGSLVTVYIDGTAVGTTTADGTGSGSTTSRPAAGRRAYGTCHRDRYRRQCQCRDDARTFTVDTTAPATRQGLR